MKKIYIALMVSGFIMSGCAGTEQSEDISMNVGSTIQSAGMMSGEMQNNSVHSSIEDNDKVFWNLKEVHNVQRIDTFIEHVNQKVTDAIKVETTSKEGEAVIKELVFDGEALLLTSYGETKSYERIYTEERYSEHYKGVFVEYWVEGPEEENKELILQIHPDLQ
ncbi:DUF4362 domain-containing protein [Marinicrinis lubricantis]|uniref:DUF4362 domain-containing protein n=1 Tax=Marinicrinis lubricantis TaxID=2086470 RepID=A0ABW1IK11_9BACL